jgi:GalNAc-alpha-(1->4)-GalNAc-alpha-(1->3)-diNAcBac-PP-undecaprenol alpha-1,4-N-acetyl-D-galactosaminyltransferase
MKLLIVIASLTSGGSERNATILANEFANRGCDVFLGHLHPSDVFYKVSSSVTVLDFSDGKMGKHFFHWRRALRRALRQYHFDSIVSFSFPLGAFVFLALPHKGVRFICREVGDPTNPDRSRFAYSFYDFVLRRTDGVVFQTDFQKRCYSKKIGKISHVINNPVILPASASKCLISSKKIIAVGRLTKQKDYSTLIKAFGLFCQKRPGYHLYIYGEGPLMENLSKEIFSYHLQNDVFLAGTTQDVFSKFEDACCFVHPSLHEGLPNSVLEAFLYGVPVISSDWPGFDSFLKDRQNSLIFHKGDFQELSQCMILMVDHPEMRKGLSENAVALRQNFSLPAITDLWYSLLFGNKK